MPKMRSSIRKLNAVLSVWWYRYHHTESTAFSLRMLDRIFGIKEQAVQIRQHRQYRFAGLLFQPFQTRLQQANVATKTIDDETDRALAFALGQTSQRAYDCLLYTSPSPRDS